MFTGIIEDVGHLERVQPLGGGVRLTVRSPLAKELRIDQSIAIQGACQTVVAQTEETFEVVAVEETLAKTTLGELEEGSPVNLERAMQPGGRLDGHFVMGHVDATGQVAGREELEDSWLFHIEFGAKFAPFVIPVGSVAVDGVSLTVARLEGERLTVSIIPHTYEHTTVSQWKPGTNVNLEFDMLGKYVVRAMQTGAVESPSEGTPDA